jgi:hypothetical protein
VASLPAIDHATAAPSIAMGWPSPVESFGRQMTSAQDAMDEGEGWVELYTLLILKPSLKNVSHVKRLSVAA